MINAPCFDEMNIQKSFVQVNRYFRYLNIPPNNTALCGFFHLNMEFIFIVSILYVLTTFLYMKKSNF